MRATRGMAENALTMSLHSLYTSVPLMRQPLFTRAARDTVSPRQALTSKKVAAQKTTTSPMPPIATPGT